MGNSFSKFVVLEVLKYGGERKGSFLRIVLPARVREADVDGDL